MKAKRAFVWMVALAAAAVMARVPGFQSLARGPWTPGAVSWSGERTFAADASQPSLLRELWLWHGDLSAREGEAVLFYSEDGQTYLQVDPATAEGLTSEVEALGLESLMPCPGSGFGCPGLCPPVPGFVEACKVIFIFVPPTLRCMCIYTGPYSLGRPVAIEAGDDWTVTRLWVEARTVTPGTPSLLVASLAEPRD